MRWSSATPAATGSPTSARKCCRPREVEVAVGDFEQELVVSKRNAAGVIRLTCPEPLVDRLTQSGLLDRFHALQLDCRTRAGPRPRRQLDKEDLAAYCKRPLKPRQNKALGACARFGGEELLVHLEGCSSNPAWTRSCRMP
ncbi:MULTISPECIES: hypothetical protein [unclassified Variovorax]|uniref:hypothetical protein n=1 Tax=unclassified Variovorax TaxID=663243 RepID=UPI001BD6BEBF|nr:MULTISPECIES: hypothetical protein [unclassified Variovorax]